MSASAANADSKLPHLKRQNCHGSTVNLDFRLSRKGEVMARTPDKSTKGPALRAQADATPQATTRDVTTMPITDVQQFLHVLQSQAD